jgi:hypothetical protein
MTTPSRSLAALVACLLGAGAATIAVHHPSGPRRATPASAPTGASTTALSDATFGLTPRPGQALLKGTLTGLLADNAEAPPLQPPFVITVPNRGQGGATFRGVQVHGQTVAISWYGGQPLPLSGTGGLDLAGAPVTVDAGGVTWNLDGATRGLTPGHYSLGAPIAVGAAGLATPMDSVSFEAGPTGTVETSGGANVHVGPTPLRLEGPGRVTLRGQFALRTPDRTRTVTTLAFGPGDYQIDLAPVSGGYRINAILQGPLSPPS